jgi:YVTN family beta-propeller protein
LTHKTLTEKIWRGAKTALALGALLLAASCGTSSKPSDISVTRPGKKMPWGMALSTDGTKLYVANQTSYTVDIYDTSSMKLLDSIPVMCDPRQLALRVVDGVDTKLFVSHMGLTADPLRPKYCAYSQISYDKRSNGWVSVIDLLASPPLKVTNEISLAYGSSDISSGPTRITYDSDADVFYVSTSVKANYLIAVIDAQSETVLHYMTTFVGSKTPFRVVVDTRRHYPSTSTHNLSYLLDSANAKIYPFAIDNISTASYKYVTFDGQSTGYCAGTTKLANYCACSSDTACNSGLCYKEAGQQLYYCKPNCSASSAQTGCACSTVADCAPGLSCVDNLCATTSMIALGTTSIVGYCDPEGTQCKTPCKTSGDDKAICKTNPLDNPAIYNSDNRQCSSPWALLPLSDNTLYVSCYGGTTDLDATSEQPVYRVIVNDKGLASNGTAVVTEASFQECLRPTELASDPSERYVFVACTGNNSIQVYDPYDGSLVEDLALPGIPTGLIASDDYVFATMGAQDAIYKYPISRLPVTAGVAQ